MKRGCKVDSNSLRFSQGEAKVKLDDARTIAFLVCFFSNYFIRRTPFEIGISELNCNAYVCTDLIFSILLKKFIHSLISQGMPCRFN